MGPFRSTHLPRDVAGYLGRRDGILASAPLPGGVHAVALATRITAIGPDGVLWQRPWHEVDHGTWDEAGPSITIRWIEGSQTVLTFTGDPPRAFLEAFRERVQSSVVHVERLELRSGLTVRAVIRRAENGGLFSQVIADGEIGPQEADATAIRDLESRARRAVGLPG